MYKYPSIHVISVNCALFQTFLRASRTFLHRTRLQSPIKCDLIPLVFFLQDYINSRVYENNPGTIEKLKAEIRERVAEFDEEMPSDLDKLC